MENQIIDAEYIKREENIVFEGSHRGINYSITENDYERKEISTTPESAHLFAKDQTILLEILNKHYGNTPSAGIPKNAGYSKTYGLVIPIQEPYVNENKVGRNEPCTCGSGKKYKKCCG